MNREQAVKQCREEFDSHGLSDWHIRLTTDSNSRFLGLCSHKDKCIILSAHHIDIHPSEEVINTIRHEMAHALVGSGNGHNEVWQSKAKEVGCSNTAPCSNLSLSPEIIEAIRSGATVEITFDEETIRRPKYQITRLQDKCEHCGKVAKVKSELFVQSKNEIDPDEKYIFLECGHLIIKKIPKGTPFQTLIWNVPDDKKDCKHNWAGKTVCTLCGAFKAYPFQVEGMRFIEAALSINKGAAVFDEMGLGKTNQACGYLRFHPENLPVLYIVKSAIKFQWFKQILSIMGDEFVGQIISKSDDILIPGLKTYIISYDLLVFKTRTSKKGKTINQGFDITKFDGIIKTVVLDECQQIKNPDSSRTQQVRRIVKDKAVIALSGTPWKNRGSEFFSVLNMLAPTKFSSYGNYIQRWVDTYWDGNKQKEGGIRNPEKFKEYIKDIAIRREIADVAIEMPDVNRMRLDIQLDDLSQVTYDDEVSEFVKWYNQFILDGTEESVSGIHILAKLARMRHITGLAKIEATEAFAEEFLEDTDRKLTVFIHHKDVGEILYDNFKKKFGGELPILKLTGEQSGEERFRVQEQFQSCKRTFLIASTLAAGEGLNLQSCSDAVLHERQWNPANEDQAAPGRFRRIGSTASIINVTYATAENTVDDILHGIVERKRLAFHAGMNNSELVSWNENSIAKELAQAIKAKFDAKKKPSVEGKKKLSEMVKM